jgi:diguanylate cyclase (GGDEF)-like protein
MPASAPFPPQDAAIETSAQPGEEPSPAQAPADPPAQILPVYAPDLQPKIAPAAPPPPMPALEAAAPPQTPQPMPAATSLASWQSIALIAVVALLLAGWWTARRRGRIFAAEAEQLSRQQMRLSMAHHQLKTQSERLREQSIQDPLTGVLNRAAFAAEFRELSERMAAGDRMLNLIVFDLDHFKTINDRQGHLAGDAALKLVAGIVREHLVSADLFGRFGGDEFLIACADQPLAFCRDLAERIRIAVESRALAYQPPLPGLSLSIGIAQADADSGYAADALFARADAALYEAKRKGRNRVVVADAALSLTPVVGTQRHL